MSAPAWPAPRVPDPESRPEPDLKVEPDLRVEPEQGFTLVEVVVALVLMSVTLLSAGGFMIHVISTSAALTGRQGAVSVASGVMEQVRSIDPTFDHTTGISPLVVGRGQTDVTTQWATAATAGLDVSATYTGNGTTTYDAATYSTAGTPNIPFEQTVSRGGQSYTVDTLIGTCVRPSTSTDCGRYASGNELYRVVVEVSWVPGTGRSCSGSLCNYTLSTLIDPSSDPIYNTSRKPVANNDPAVGATLATPSGVALPIGVTTNDSGNFPLYGALTIISSPAHGTAVIGASNNIVTYTPTSGYSGLDTFTYTVTDSTNLTSNIATVTINVTPIAVADTAATTTAGTAITASVLTNDVGTGLTLAAVGTPTLGTATISGTTIRYTPPAAASGIATVTYTLQDSTGQQTTGTLSVTVRPVAATTPAAALTATCWGNWMSNTLQTKTLALPSTAFLGTGPFTVLSPTLVSGPAGASVTALAGTLTYVLPPTASLPQSFTYTVADANGVVSAPITMTLKSTC